MVSDTSQTAPPESSGGRLKSSALNLSEITLSALANIGPALSIFFVMGVMIAVDGRSTPFAVVVGMVAILIVANSLIQFSRHVPSAGGFITWITEGLGRVVGRISFVILMTGYIVVLGALFVGTSFVLQGIIGTWTSSTGPWWAYTILWTVIMLALVLRGVKISARAAAGLFIFEMLVLLSLAITIFVELPSGAWSASPLTPGSGGWTGLTAVFPSVVLLFFGWEHAGALSEETDRPHRNVGRSTVTAIIGAGVVSFLVIYAAVLGYGKLSAIGDDGSPLDTLAVHYFGGAHMIADFAVLVSILSASLAALNSQSRILFNAAREGDLPRLLTKVNDRFGTPYAAITVFGVLSGATGLIWTAVLGDPGEFVELGFTFGPVLVMIIYVLLCAAVGAYYWRKHRDEFSWIKHVIVPVIGIAVLLQPFYESFKPGQESPLNIVPYATAVVVLIAVVYAVARQVQARGASARGGQPS